jgi:hypothetical protein
MHVIGERNGCGNVIVSAMCVYLYCLLHLILTSILFFSYWIVCLLEIAQTYEINGFGIRMPKPDLQAHIHRQIYISGIQMQWLLQHSLCFGGISKHNAMNKDI